MSVSELCREFGVSRPTGYRWINRYKEVGPEGLLDLSSRPHSCSHATPEKTENAILALRNKHPSWGARKLKARLEQLDPNVDWPAASTVENILQRAGLTSPKRKKRRTTPYSEPFSEVTARRINFGAWTSQAISILAMAHVAIRLPSQTLIAVI
jgi:transposase